MKVLITEKIPGPAKDMLTKEGFEVVIGSESLPLTKKELISKLKSDKFDAVLSLLTNKIDAEIFDATPSTRIFANYAVGFDNIDSEEAKRRGIVVTNTPTPLVSEAVAEHTLALIFSLMMRIPEADAFVRAGKYKAWDPNLLLHPDLLGKTVGIVGAGRIGGTVGRALHHGFNCTVLYHDIKRNDYIENDCHATFCDSLDDLLKQSDVVTLHVPLLPETKHLIRTETLQKMKRGSYLINTARGGVVDEEALAEALKKGVIAGAALDVFEQEPEPHPELLALKNVVFTPHVASATVQVRDEMSRIAADNIISFFKDGKVRTAV